MSLMWFKNGEASPRLLWFAGYASHVAAEFHRRIRRVGKALAAYGRAIDQFERAVAADPDLRLTTDHRLALAFAGLSGLAQLGYVALQPIGKVRYRRATRKRIGMMQGPQLMAIILQETKGEEGTRPVVIFSAEDLTAGLVGYPSGVVNGYDPKNAYEIMRNIVLVTSDVKLVD